MKVQTISTWHGRRWAVVDEDNCPVDYNKVSAAVFPYTKEGLAKARDFHRALLEAQGKR